MNRVEATLAAAVLGMLAAMILTLARTAAASSSSLHATAGWWTTDHVLAVANVVVAASAVGTIVFGLAAIRSAGQQAAASADMAKSAGAQARASADLATATIRQADSSDRIAESALAQNLATIRPQLVDVPKQLLSSGKDFDHEGPGKIIWVLDAQQVVLIVPVRNVGPGVAYVRIAMILSPDGLIHEPEMTARAIAPGDTAKVISIALASDGAYTALAKRYDRRAAQVALSYCDINGEQRTMTRLTIARAADGRALVGRVELFNCDNKWDPMGEPLVTTQLPSL
jgi:hypothetical protein